MKKICLLAIASFFSGLAFSQNAASTPTVPGQPKPGKEVHLKSFHTSSGANSFTTATGQTAATVATATPATTTVVATKRTATRKTTAKANL